MGKVPKDEMIVLHTAAESKSTATNAEDDTQLQAVAYAINSAANCGQLSVIFQEELRPNVESQVTGKGYTIKSASQLDRGVVISWN